MKHQESQIDYVFNGVPFDIHFWSSDKYGLFDQYVPHKPGVYAITSLSYIGAWLGHSNIVDLLYIGSTRDLRRRYLHHEVFRDFSNDQNIIRFSFLPIINTDYRGIKEIEVELIRFFKPSLNKQHNGKRPSISVL